MDKATLEAIQRLEFGLHAGDLHVDQLLSNVAINYRPRGMIADLIFPVVGVQKQSDFYAIFPRADALRQEETRRAPDTEANKIQRAVSSDKYFADNYALKMAVTVEDKANADPIWVSRILNDKVRFITSKLGLDWEQRVATLVQTGVGSSTAVASSWTDETNSDPLGDVHTAIDNVHDATGVRPNQLTMSDIAWRLLRRHDDVRNIIFGTNNGGGYPSTQQVANIFEMDRILVGNAFQNTGNENQSESLSRVWGPNVQAMYVPAQVSMEEPSFGYSFRWNVPGVPHMQAERHPYNSRRKSEEVEVGYYQDEKVTGSEYGFQLTAVNSST